MRGSCSRREQDVCAPATLQPGDIAVTVDGVLAYTGNNLWIEADPSIKRVIQVKGPDTNNNPWFEVPVQILKWRQFDEG